jgi:hypothetical protein
MANSSDEPRSGAVLPSLADTPRAGTPERQIALQNSAWEMLETFVPAEGITGTRLSNQWLGRHGWRVQIVPQWVLGRYHDWVVPLVAHGKRNPADVLLGTVVETGALRVSAVWQPPFDPDHVRRFFEAHYCVYHILFPESRAFAVHADDNNLAVYAGPEDFLREVLPPEAIGAAATAEVVEEIEEEHGEGAIDGILAHYAPFMLDR